MSLISKENMEKILNWAYDKAVNGLPAFRSAESLAKEYQQLYPNDLEKQINSLITWQSAKSGLSGALTGLGGFTTIMATLPANIASVIAIQIRMIAAIAILCGYDVKNDKVKTLILCCLVKEKIEDIIKSTVFEKLGIKLVQRIPADIIKIINKAVGQKLLIKFGQKGFINFGKAVPLFGVILGAAIDAASTKSIGFFAKKVLMSEQNKQNFTDADNNVN